MKLSSLMIAIPFMAGATVVAMVACAPKDQSVPVQIAPLSPTGQALANCAANISERNHVQPKDRAVKVCQINTKPQALAADGTPLAVLPAAGGEYETVERPISYRIKNNNGRLAVLLTIGVHYPKDMPSDKEYKAAFADTFRDICVAKIKRIWWRSGVDLAMEFPILNQNPDANVDQQMTLVSTNAVSSAPRFAMAEFPDRAFLYPRGTDEDQKACAGKTGRELQSCRFNRRSASNNDFCVNLALMVGHWVGLEAPEISQSAGGACKPSVDKPVSKEVKLGPVKSATYMKSGMTDSERLSYWKDAKLSASDLKAIFSPVCSSFRSKAAQEKNPAQAK